MIAIAPTDLEWFRQLRASPHKVVNFWTPTPWNLRQLKPGDAFYFLLKAPYRKIGGAGRFVSYENLRASEAWKRYGTANGVTSLNELIDRTQSLAKVRSTQFKANANPVVGCVVLTSPVFFDDDNLVAPEAVGLSFPRQVVKVKYFPDLNVIPGVPSEGDGDIIAIEQAVTVSTGRGQGFISDAATRKAIEKRAMTLAKEHYAASSFVVEDTSATKPFDLLCRRSGSELALRVEVKGTTGDATEIMLTTGEVGNAQNGGTDLFLVSKIKVTRGQNGPVATGGVKRIIQNWNPKDNDLSPLVYRYRVPSP